MKKFILCLMLISMPAHAQDAKWYGVIWEVTHYGGKPLERFVWRCGVVESSKVRMISKEYDPQYVAEAKDSAGKITSVKIRKTWKDGDRIIQEFYRSETECKAALKKLEPDLDLYN